jgi:hypothetical protein
VTRCNWFRRDKYVKELDSPAAAEVLPAPDGAAKPAQAEKIDEDWLLSRLSR